MRSDLQIGTWCIRFSTTMRLGRKTDDDPVCLYYANAIRNAIVRLTGCDPSEVWSHTKNVWDRGRPVRQYRLVWPGRILTVTLTFSTRLSDLSSSCHAPALLSNIISINAYRFSLLRSTPELSRGFGIAILAGLQTWLYAKGCVFWRYFGHYYNAVWYSRHNCISDPAVPTARLSQNPTTTQWRFCCTICQRFPEKEVQASRQT